MSHIVILLSTCEHRNHNLVLYTFMTYHRIGNNSNTTRPLVAQELLTRPKSFLVGFMVANL